MKSDKAQKTQGNAQNPDPPTYEPVDCPSGGPKQQCQSLNDWGAAWEAWGLTVKQAIENLTGGGPTGVSPPPKPPYKP